MLAPVAPVVVLGFLFFKPPWTPMRVAGFILFVSAFALLTWARASLGNSFSVTPQAKVLVTRGLYSKVRHPVYVFGILFLIGMALYAGYPWAVFPLLLLVPVQVIRARAEEKVLIEKFGEEYLQYRKRTWL